MTSVSPDELYMRRCLQVAEHALGRTAPNPLVGCVIVRDGQVVSEGYHPYCGAFHAERNALLHCPDAALLQGATLYVNLEPCAHEGRTPPCAPLVAGSGVRRVVVCNDDPNPLVCGRGYQLLRQAGIVVETHVLEPAGRFLNRRFFTAMEQHRPYIILKWAQSRDGFMDVDRSDGQPHSYWLTQRAAQIMSHRWRTEEDAILIGSQTFVNDRPQLTARLWHGRQPRRYVADRRGRLPGLLPADAANPWHLLPQGDVPQMVEALARDGVQSVIVEGGRRLLEAFLEADLYDEIRIFTAARTLSRGLPAPLPPQELPRQEQQVGPDRLTLIYKSFRP